MAGTSELRGGEQYERRRFRGLVNAGEKLTSAEFDGCTFERCNLAGMAFYRCALRDCRFVECDLSGITVPNCTVTGVRFERSKLIGVDWTVAGASEVSRALFSVGFVDSLLDLSSFFGMGLHGLSMTGCTAREVDFAEADLSGACFEGTDLGGSKFLHTNLEEANLVGASSYAIDPTTNRVRGARFSLPEAVSLLRGFDIVIED
jgi:uncharacterized protein YjbI with pentapeptide repeats